MTMIGPMIRGKNGKLERANKPGSAKNKKIVLDEINKLERINKEFNNIFNLEEDEKNRIDPKQIQYDKDTIRKLLLYLKKETDTLVITDFGITSGIRLSNWLEAESERIRTGEDSDVNTQIANSIKIRDYILNEIVRLKKLYEN